MPPVAICHMCGYSEDEVEKLHYFPSTLTKSKGWQENMGLQFAGESLRNKRICSRHFTEASYTDLVSRKLRPNAVPTLLPVSQPSSVKPSVSTFMVVQEKNIQLQAERKEKRQATKKKKTAQQKKVQKFKHS